MTAGGRASGRRRREHEAASLPLGIPQADALPGPIRPEMPQPCSDAFDSEAWRFSVDWEGSRALLFAGPGGTVRMQAETLADITLRFPELARAADHVTGAPVVLDGVIVVLDSQGRPDLEALGLRLALGARGAGQLPAAFLATDVLHAGAEPTLGWDLDRRLELLGRLVRPARVLQAPETVEARGSGLAEAAGARGLSAVLARRSRSPYRAGLQSPNRLRIDLRRRATCVVVGIEEGTERPSLILAEHAAGVLVFAARVTGPRQTAVERWLAEAAALVATAESPLHSTRAHRFGRAGDVIWLRPVLTATVAHHGRHEDGTLRDPRLIAVRDDVDARWCVRRDPVPPPAAPAPHAFAPTVLLPLPLGDAGVLSLNPSPGRGV